jgi:hypothetical protein
MYKFSDILAQDSAAANYEATMYFKRITAVFLSMKGKGAEESSARTR